MYLKRGCSWLRRRGLVHFTLHHWSRQVTNNTEQGEAGWGDEVRPRAFIPAPTWTPSTNTDKNEHLYTVHVNKRGTYVYVRRGTEARVNPRPLRNNSGSFGVERSRGIFARGQTSSDSTYDATLWIAIIIPLLVLCLIVDYHLPSYFKLHSLQL